MPAPFRRLRRAARSHPVALRSLAVVLGLYLVDLMHVNYFAHWVARPSPLSLVEGVGGAGAAEAGAGPEAGGAGGGGGGRWGDGDLDGPFVTGCLDPAESARSHARANATLVMLARNSDVDAACETLAGLDRSFNRWFGYPVLFLNDDRWLPHVQWRLRACAGAAANVSFEVIDEKDWSVLPDWMDETDLRAALAAQKARHVFRGGRESYHHMCRFYSGKFFMHEALKQYKWYWRLEPGVKYTCAITYDPFVEMERHGKVYGFTLALWEKSSTSPSLFRAADDFRRAKGIPASEPMWQAMIDLQWEPWPVRKLRGHLGSSRYDRDGNLWNMCHYWSNFEIADLDFFRGNDYQEFFDHLDKEGGFYMERWGDAPVHSLGVHLLLGPDKVHHFSDMGYYHKPFYQCPGNAPGRQLPGNVELGSQENSSAERPGAIGCRCECENDTRRNFPSTCLAKLQAPAAYHRPSFLDWVLQRYPYALNMP